MARADLRLTTRPPRATLGVKAGRRPHRPVALAALVLASQWPLPEAAASSPPAGTPTDLRYTPVSAGNAALLPRQPDHDAQPGVVFRGEQPGGLGYAANAAVARVLVEVARDGVPADGQSPVAITVRLFGADGQPLRGELLATVEHSGGRLQLPGARTDEAGPRGLDADRATPGVQLKVVDGVARFALLAPTEAQDVRLRVTAGAHEAGGTISFVPELRPMIAAGLLEGIVSFRNRTVLSPVRRGDAFEREIDAWSRSFRGGKADAGARAAFFLKGTVRGDLLLTAAYDSDKDTRARLLRDVRPDEFYPVYGDASLKSFDARSGSRLYVRIDKGKHYALFGDFVTADGFSQPVGQGMVAPLKARSLGAWNRSATGLRLHHEDGRFNGNLFVFNDTLRAVVEELASQGAGPYGLRHNQVLEGSEKVEVLVRDRNQPARIVSVRPLQRLVDYSFEPFSGRIVLASFLHAVDDQLNPVSLRISYEVDQGGEAYWALGADLQVKLGQQLEVGGAVVSDRNRLSPYELVSANATWQVAPGTTVVAELAQSTSTVNTNPANQAITPGLAWGRTSPLFNNPSSPMPGGREELFVQGGLKLTPSLKLTAEALRSEDRNTGGGQRDSAALGLRWLATEQLTLEASLRRARETTGTQGNGYLSSPFGLTNGLTSGLSGSIATGSAGGALGFGAQVLDPATGLPVIVQGGLAPANSSLPAGTRLASDSLRLGLGWKVNDRLRLGAEAEADVSGDARRRGALGADYLVAERTRLYGRYERQSGWVQLAGVSDTGRSASAFALGVESTYLRDTQLFSEYRLRDAVAGRDLQLASGMRHFWNIAEGWRADVALEQIKVLSGDAAKTGAIAGGLDWTAHPLWRASTRLELRQSGDRPGTLEDDRFHTTLWQVMAARKLDRDWTLLARNHLLHSDYRARGDVLQNRAQVGLAYRDTDTNRVNALGKLEYKLERDASNAATGPLRSSAWIASTHADWHPSRPWWLSGRVAAKWQADRFEGGVDSRFNAALLGGRAVYDITERWDIGLMAAAQLGQRGARQHALGAEVGYLLRQNLWLSAGLNATGFAGDADLVGYEYTRQGAYLRLRFKFDETLFKSRDREVNRSLPR
jgi:hypothetical protein